MRRGQLFGETYNTDFPIQRFGQQVSIQGDAAAALIKSLSHVLSGEVRCAYVHRRVPFPECFTEGIFSKQNSATLPAQISAVASSTHMNSGTIMKLMNAIAPI